MTMRIGAVLGLDMSFQRPNGGPGPGWVRVTGQHSAYLGNSLSVHSSESRALIEAYSSSIGSGSQGPIENNSTTLQDFRKYAFTDVTTHQLDLRFWADALSAPSSGQLAVVFASGSATLRLPVIYSGSMAMHFGTVAGMVLPNSILNAEDFMLRVERNVPIVGSATISLDDMLLAVDPVDINPEWTARYVQRSLRDESVGQDGKTFLFHYGTTREAQLPMRFVPASVASLLNHWWRVQAPLALTFDTADGETTHLYRLVNPAAPFAERLQPRQDLRTGALQLYEIGGGGLEF